MAKKRVSVTGYKRRNRGRLEHVDGYTRRQESKLSDLPSFLALRRRTGIHAPRRPSTEKVYYHVTRPETVQTILSEGLRGQFMRDRILVWDNLESARRYVEERKQDGREADETPVKRVIIRLRLPRDLGRDEGSAYGIPGGLAVHSRGIPPEYIQGVTN